MEESPVTTRKPRVQACDRCRTRKRKCNGEKPMCNNCQHANERGTLESPCTYSEKKKRSRRQTRDVLLERLEALEKLLEPFKGRNDPSAEAARAEMAGILQGLGRRGSNDDSESEAEGDEGDDDQDGLLAPDSSRSTGHSPSGMQTTRASFYGSPDMDNVPAPHRDRSHSVSSSIVSQQTAMFKNLALSPDVPYASPIELSVSPSTFLTYAQDFSKADAPSQLPHLYTHLIGLYFAYVNICMPLFNEAYFFQNLIPENNHPPALLYAIYAFGCLHSRHPALYREPYGNPRKASAMFHTEAAKSWMGIEDPVIQCQVLVMLGKWSFGMNAPTEALQFMSSAIQSSERVRLGYGYAESRQRLLTLWHAPNPTFGPRHTALTLRTTWYFCFVADTCVAIAGDQAPLIEESLYTHALTDPIQREDARLVSDPLFLDMDSDPKGLWRHLLAGHPSYSIHDFRPNVWTPTIDALEYSCDRTKPWFLQLNFILRRVHRFARSTPISATTGQSSADIVLSLLPHLSGKTQMERENARSRLHNRLVDWWCSLPNEERAFESLDVFQDGADIPPLPSVAQLASYQFTMMNFFHVAAYALLHHREGADLEMDLEDIASFKTSTRSQQYVTSSEILKRAMRAQAFIIRSVYAMNGFDAIPNEFVNMSYSNLSAECPAPPLMFIQNPVTCYTVHSVGAAMLASISRKRRHGKYAWEHEYMEAMQTIKTTFLPTLDGGRGVWEVMGFYADKLRSLAVELEREVGLAA
ncbi:hypothetical protein BC832DRAFT_70636 [Gaertneriomyces semiglobifer]|nr:hypothetical protein BC832DRAFT_399832 [Gaertneriomyces semiglobifer]KAI9004072.1 hypothetical protein BC832DRAFT_70636 [Gaertneriomyces semiglobifer]